MALDTRYIPLSQLQGLFRDKDTGLPLRSGKIWFYKDQFRTQLKDIYKITGTPPNYSYVPIANPMTLTGIGTFSDGGNNDITPYLYPYSSHESDAVVELYYVVVKSSGDIPQFTREGVPNVSDEAEDAQGVVNYVPNGQFLLHNDLPAFDNFETGEIRNHITNIAYGGWTFERPEASTATDKVTFSPETQYTENPTGSPRYEVKILTETENSGDTIKDLRLRFNDVNKFASTTLEYTFYFEAQTLSGDSTPVELLLIKNYGTGGSSESSQSLAEFNITNVMSDYHQAFVFGSNASKTIGIQNDDYLQLALRLPLASLFDVKFTNFILTDGNVTLIAFPPTTNAQFTYRSLAGFIPIPAYDGSDLYLPIRLTASGFEFDSSEIGNVIAETQLSVYVNSLHPSTNRMLANGLQYETTDYSDLGIPYSRLQAKYWSSTLNTPIYGTGAEYFTGIFSGAGNELRITNNSAGSVTATADGAVPTGFTFLTVHTGATTYALKSYLVAADQFYIEGTVLGAPFATVPTAVAAGTSTFTVAEIQIGTSLLAEIGSVTTVVAAGLAGLYFTFNNTTTAYYVWFQVDGAGADPAVASRTGILVSLNSVDTAAVVAQKIRESLNGWQVTTIATLAASAMTSGDYFTLNSTTLGYFVWYRIDGAGTEPVVVGRTGIQVDLAGSDTNTQVATKTQQAINQKYFAVPDLRGMFVRGWNNGATNDPDAATRWSLVPGIIGDVLGTFQESANLSHHHITPEGFIVGAAVAGTVGGPDSTGVQSQYSGGHESRPLNMYVNYAIKY